MWAWFDLFKFGYATVIFFTPKSLLTWRVLYIFELDVVKLLNYILLERLFFLPEPGQIHVFDKNQTSDIIKHLPTPFLVCSCLSAQAYTPYLVGIDMERSLRRSEPPMPGPPGLRTRRARLMAAWSITSSDFWRWFTGRSRISLK